MVQQPGSLEQHAAASWLRIWGAAYAALRRSRQSSTGRLVRRRFCGRSRSGDCPADRVSSAEMPVEKARLRFERFLRFRKVVPVPKGVRHCVENHQPGVHACPQEGAMKFDRAAETVVAGRSHAQCRRKSSEIRMYRRKHWIPHGKGDKPREVPLSRKLLDQLRTYYRSVQHWRRFASRAMRSRPSHEPTHLGGGRHLPRVRRALPRTQPDARRLAAAQGHARHRALPDGRARPTSRPCVDCGEDLGFSFNSCRNRHCPSVRRRRATAGWRRARANWSPSATFTSCSRSLISFPH